MALIFYLNEMVGKIKGLPLGSSLKKFLVLTITYVILISANNRHAFLEKQDGFFRQFGSYLSSKCCLIKATIQ